MADGTGKNKKRTTSAKELAYLAVFVALLIGGQFVFAALPGVEIVTVLFVTYAYVFGTRRGMVAATAFSLLRQLVFGFFPTTLVLYLIYFNGVAAVFGLMGQGKRVKLSQITLVACLSTACFSVLDGLITSLWYSYSWTVAKAYFFAALPVAIPQIICAATTVFLLFLPLRKIFTAARARLN